MDRTGHVQLLLGQPGQAAPTLPRSSWRLWTPTAQGLIDPGAVAAAGRPSPMASRAEKALVAAVASDDLDGLGRLAAQAGPVRSAAQVLHAGRLVAVDAVLATEVLITLLSSPADPADSKALRRTWGNLCVGLSLAPGVPALVPMGRLAIGLLLADVCVAGGRPADAVAVLRQLPAQPAVVLALAAALLSMGEHEQVIEVTTRLDAGGEVAAVTLVARSVAARQLSELATALDAASGALVAGEREAAVLAMALEERSRVYAQAGADASAHADLEALAALAAGATDVVIPDASPLTRASAAPSSEDDHMHRARDRVRRRIVGVGAPGTFGGRHHSTYRDDVADMFSLGRIDAVEELLLGLIDAVEDEVAETGATLDPTFFLTLVDLYEDQGRAEDLAALRERFESAQARTGTGAGDGPPEGPAEPAPFDVPPPVDVDSVSIDGRQVDVEAAVEHLLVSVGVASAEPAPAIEVDEAASERPAVVPAPEGAVRDDDRQPERRDDQVAERPGAAQSLDGADDPSHDEAKATIERVARGPRIRSL